MARTHYTGQVNFKKSRIDVRDENGDKVSGKKTGPTGKITDIKCLTLVSVQTRNPSGECYIYYNGRWYKIC
jgi:hypothetical protein